MFRTSATIIVCTALGACSSLWRGDPSGDQKHEKDALAISRDLDVIARDIEEYGSITASTGLPIIGPSEHFKFNLDLKPREILAMQGVQGLSAIRSFREFSAALAARADVAKTPLLPNTPAPAGNVAVPTLPPAEPRATPEAFSPALTAANPDELDISVRDLIKRVFDDHTTIKLLEYLSSADPDTVGSNYQLYASVLTVSLRPGRETYRGYIGEIDIRLSYAGKCRTSAGAEEFRRGTEHPLAFAVFPAVDSHTIDQRTSLRQQFALALALEAAAPQAAGALSTALRRRLEQDAATRTVLNHVVGFNASGRHFGWRFTPSFVAQADPANMDTKPANILQPQSFPALALIMAAKSDLKLDGKKDEISACPENSRYAAKPYTHLMFLPTSRWLRAPNPSADSSWVPFSGEWSRFMRPRLSEEIITDWGIRLERARSKMGDLPRSGSPYVWNSLAKRVNALEAASIGADTYLPLPLEATRVESPRAIVSVSPSHGWLDAPTTFVVRGRGFAPGMQFFIGGQPIPSPAILGENVAVLRLNGPPSPGKAGGHAADVSAAWPAAGEDKKGATATIKDAVTFDLAKPKDVAVATNRLVLEWEAGAEGQRKLKSMAVFGNPPAAEIIKALAGAEKTVISGTGTAKVEIEIKPDGAAKKN